MTVKIIRGNYGVRGKYGVKAVRMGEECEVSEAEAARLIGLGVAENVAGAAQIAPVEASDTAAGNFTPDAGSSPEATGAAHLDPDQLRTMTVADLKKIAADMGLATSKLKNKEQLVEAIYSVEVEPGEETEDGSDDVPAVGALLPEA